ncbi:unnamed protein product [Hyaloperonospora brassicae]|uniref:Glutathione transferase n=1 Tax=Hyaloperonospora brassicae TaxID=162125 RepID=A0AAV0UZ08_HYABA|nr:unnamed protein product [Hyaloperonospora brassicae]
MAPHLKLTYFDMKARAEVSRMLFHYGDVAFVDERLSHADFGAMKSKLPLGQVPLLEIDGAVYPQSMAIMRYAAKRARLYPSDPVKALKADAVSYSLNELTAPFIEFTIFTPDADEKAKKRTAFLEEKVPKVLTVAENLVEGKFLTGDSMSFADVQLFDFVENCVKVLTPTFDMSALPKLEALLKNVAADPKIAAYQAGSK